MALQTIKGGLVIPPPPIGYATSPSLASLTLDAANEAVAFIVAIPATGSIRKVIWQTSTVTTGATLDIRLETLSIASTPATPSGSLWGTDTNGSQVVGNADDFTGFATQLTADASVTAGDILAVRINNPAASFGNLQVATLNDDTQSRFPYCALFTGAWASVGAAPIVAFEYSDGSYETVAGCYPSSGDTNANTISTSSTPDVVGSRFQIPFVGRVRGCWLWIDADGDFVARVVSEDYHQGNETGILASTATINNQKRFSGLPGIHWLPFTSPVELLAGTNYRFIVEPTTTTAIMLYDFNVISLAAMDAYYGGQTWHLTTAKDPVGDGDWTNYNTGTFRKFFGGLVFDAFDDGGPSDAEIAEAVWEYADRTLT